MRKRSETMEPAAADPRRQSVLTAPGYFDYEEVVKVTVATELIGWGAVFAAAAIELLLHGHGNALWWRHAVAGTIGALGIHVLLRSYDLIGIRVGGGRLGIQEGEHLRMEIQVGEIDWIAKDQLRCLRDGFPPYLRRQGVVCYAHTVGGAVLMKIRGSQTMVLLRTNRTDDLARAMGKELLAEEPKEQITDAV